MTPNEAQQQEAKKWIASHRKGMACDRCGSGEFRLSKLKIRKDVQPLESNYLQAIATLACGVCASAVVISPIPLPM